MDRRRLILVKIMNVLADFAFILRTRPAFPMLPRSLKIPLRPMHEEFDLYQNIHFKNLNQQVKSTFVIGSFIFPFSLAHRLWAVLIEHPKKERAEGRFVDVLKPNYTGVLQCEPLCFSKRILNQLFNHDVSIDARKNHLGVFV